MDSSRRVQTERSRKKLNLARDDITNIPKQKIIETAEVEVQSNIPQYYQYCIHISTNKQRFG